MVVVKGTAAFTLFPELVNVATCVAPPSIVYCTDATSAAPSASVAVSTTCDVTPSRTGEGLIVMLWQTGADITM